MSGKEMVEEGRPALSDPDDSEVGQRPRLRLACYSFLSGAKLPLQLKDLLLYPLFCLCCWRVSAISSAPCMPTFTLRSSWLLLLSNCLCSDRRRWAYPGLSTWSSRRSASAAAPRGLPSGF